MKPLRTLAVMGTRPEVIKMAPVIRRLSDDRKNFRLKVCVSAQHRDLLDTMLKVFGIRPHVDLDVMRTGQSLNGILTRVIDGMDAVLRDSPTDLMLVQGDTTTVLGSALAAFHRRVPVGHVEAGLRSFDLSNPFPEEMNRVQVDHLSTLHFAPTQPSAVSLRREGIKEGSIFVTGNTSIDALHWAARAPLRPECRELRAIPAMASLALVTLHRRESFGKTLEGILAALRCASAVRPEILWIYPVHPNPEVRRAAASLRNHPRFRLLEPLAYPDFVHLMKRAAFIVTDSGGIQEEAPSFGTPVLVVRETTERGELLSRNGKLVGTKPAALLKAILDMPVEGRRAVALGNPFGDGKAAERIRQAILSWAGRRPRPRDFVGC